MFFGEFLYHRPPVDVAIHVRSLPLDQPLSLERRQALGRDEPAEHNRGAPPATRFAVNVDPLHTITVLPNISDCTFELM